MQVTLSLSIEGAEPRSFVRTYLLPEAPPDGDGFRSAARVLDRAMIQDVHASPGADCGAAPTSAASNAPLEALRERVEALEERASNLERQVRELVAALEAPKVLSDGQVS